jgi:mannitol/fructose-specific phosphotransferase system IIA component (Ntr-type)
VITSLLEKESRLFANVTCKHWEEVVDILAKPMIAEGAITPEFAESAKEAAQQFGGYVVLVEDIAFFHGRPEAGVREISMSLALLTEPVYLFEKRIKAAFLFAAIDTESHGELLRGLAAIMNDDTCLDLLRDRSDPQAILKKCKEAEAANEVS